IRAEARVACDAGDRTDVDDAAVATLNHAARDGLRDEETSAQIGVEDQVPVLPADLEGRLADVAAGIVDQHVHAANGGFGIGAESADAVVVADVEFERRGSAA